MTGLLKSNIMILLFNQNHLAGQAVFISGGSALEVNSRGNLVSVIVLRIPDHSDCTCI